MKISKYFIALACLAATFSLASCNDWLDVNTDPDSPNNKSAQVDNRLPWIERWFMYEHGIVNMRTSCNIGVFYSTTGSLGCPDWEFGAGSTTTPYQSFFIGCANNLPDMYEKAQAEGATHYMAVADIIHAYGFMDMLDLYGEMPYTEALGSSPVPAYDDGKTIFYGCLDKLNEAIELLGQPQQAGATPLSAGDLCGGDPAKWQKLAYGLKARYLLRLSKKSDLFDPDEILNCLAKGPQSNNDIVFVPCYNDGADVTDYLMGDPVMTNGNWNYLAYGNNQRISKYHYDLLTNMRGAGVQDPRFEKIVPCIMTNIKFGADGKVASYDWNRSQPVDIIKDANGRLAAGGAFSITIPTLAWDKDVEKEYEISDAAKRTQFVNDMKKNHAVKVDGDKVTVTYARGAVYVNSANYALAGDTAYVNLRSNSMKTRGLDPLVVYWDFNNNDIRSTGAAGSTGTFQCLPMSNFDLLTYSECCFIKAEVLFRKGDKAGAFAAYKAGIQANFDQMQAKANEYKSAGYDNPNMMPMKQADITAYMASKAVCQSAGELTMSDIMLQKYVAVGCCSETYVDMRRFNYSAGNVGSFGVIYPGMDHPAMFSGQAVLTGSSKTDPQYWPRRWRLPGTLELTYNETEALKANVHALDPNIWSIPVWWDCATDAEYYNYIQQ